MPPINNGFFEGVNFAGSQWTEVAITPKTLSDDNSIVKEESITLIVKREESQPSFQIIDLRNANPHIRDQVEKMWPNRMKDFANGLPEGDKIVCITLANTLIGCVALEQLTIASPSSLVQEIGSQKVYALNMHVQQNYQGKGYGRAVFNSACNLVINEGALVFIADKSDHGIGDRLYGGEKTRALFDVYHVLKGTRGEYLLKKKIQEKNSLNYLKIDPNDTYVLSTTVQSLEGMNHVINYLDSYPEDINLVNSSITKYCEFILKIYKDTWDREKLIKYTIYLDKLKEALDRAQSIVD